METWNGNKWIKNEVNMQIDTSLWNKKWEKLWKMHKIHKMQDENKGVSER